MPASTRFETALLVLAILAEEKPAPVTSEALAASIGANPAALRKLLGMLAAAGLTRAQLGKGGGAMLARGAKKVTLLDIYQAVESAPLIASRRTSEAAGHPMDGEVAAAFAEATRPAEKAFFAALAGTTLKQFTKRLNGAGYD
jgi:Rrf2 family protein